MTYLSKYLESLRNEYDLGINQGFVNTHLDGVRFFWGENPIESGAMVYPSGIVIIGQGKKVGHFGTETFTYDENNFLIVSVTTPFECTTFASKEEPLLGISIEVDIADLSEIATTLKSIDDKSFKKAELVQGVLPMPISEDMHITIERLLKCLTSASESKVIGKPLVKEVLYRVLQSKHGSALYALTNENTAPTRVAKVVDYIRQNYQSKMTVESLASFASMSETTFYRAFKSLTGHSPLQYVKKIRLSRARSLIVHDGVKANVAAYEVGYDNPSQFSREFKRFFHVTPAKAKGKGYADIDVWH